MKCIKTSLQFLNYTLILFILWPISLFSYKKIHSFAKSLSTILFTLPFIRKRICSNLCIALNVPSNNVYKIAKGSLSRLITTLLEFLKIYREKNLDKIVTCTNTHVIDELIKKKQGAVIFCGHLGNWELMFLERTRFMDCIAVGRPLKNPFLYKLITKVRERFNIKMVPPKNALKESLKALRSNKFVGLVSDQAFLKEGIETKFFNQKVLSSPMAATLAYKTNKPLIVVTNVCIKGHYYTTFHDPIYKNQSLQRSQAIQEMTQKALAFLEKEILSHPDQYLWLHNRFKRVCHTKRKYRSEANLILLSPNSLEKYRAKLLVIQKIYPNSQNYLFIHENESKQAPSNFHVKSYKSINELFFIDYRYKLLFNFTENKKISNHFIKQSVSNIFHSSNFHKIGTANSHY